MHLLTRRLYQLSVHVRAPLKGVLYRMCPWPKNNTGVSRCSERLPKYKMPESVKLIRALPKNASGKVNKVRCLEMINI